MIILRILAAIAALVMCVPCAAEPVWSADEVHAAVDMMFLAAAGTTAEEGEALREDMSEDELLALNEEMALYRCLTLPWIMAAFGHAPEAESDEETQEEIKWSPEDSYEAFSLNEYGRQYVDMLAEMGGEDFETALILMREICSLWLSEIDHVKLTDLNSEYAFWLFAPGTQIDYPVVQTKDNDFYLHRLFNGEWNAAGTLFVDYRNLPDFQDPNTLIYGHHMRNDSMFGALTDYADQAWYDAHPFMLVVSPSGIYIVEIFAGYTTSHKDHCYDIAISDEEDMRDFLDVAFAKSDFASGVNVETMDTLVTLSTCAYAFENARYIAIGRLLPVEIPESGIE